MARQLLAVFLHGLPSEPGCTIIAAVARRLARRNTSYLGERALHNNIFNFDMKGPYFTKMWVHSCPQSYLDTSQGAYRCPCTSVTLDRFVLTTTHYNSPQLTSAVAGHCRDAWAWRMNPRSAYSGVPQSRAFRSFHCHMQ